MTITNKRISTQNNPTFLPNIHIPGNNSSRNIPTEHPTTTLFKTFNFNLQGNVPSVKQFY